MNKILLGLACIVTFTFILLLWEEADAARFGRGRSFGSKPFMSQPFTKPAPQVAPSMRQQQTPGSAATATAGASRFGGMGGMFGGLLAGTLIGSLLFGGGFQGGGFMDILLIGGLLYLALKLFGRRAAQSTSNTSGKMPTNMPTSMAGTAGTMYGNSSGNNSSTMYENSSADQDATLHGTSWDSLKEKPTDNKGGDNFRGTSAQTTSWDSLQNNKQDASSQSSHTIADFDVEDFLRGAKLMYARLNASWDNRDLDDIAQFSTASFMKTIREQAAESADGGRTDIILVNASLVDMGTVSGEQTASVFFSVLLREADIKGASAAPTELQEVWHFTRPSSGRGQWSLDGIQQTKNI